MKDKTKRKYQITNVTNQNNSNITGSSLGVNQNQGWTSYLTSFWK
jgi:hypothetical protein